MYLNQLKISFLFLLITLCSVNESAAQSQKEHIEVVLRMVGHQLLLNSGDSTSLVLPIEKEGEKFRIPFETEFQFVPNELVSSIDSIIRATKIANRYRVEIEDTEQGAIVYSYEVDSTQSIVIPCAKRNQEKEKYAVLVSLFDENGNYISVKMESEDLQANGSIQKESTSSIGLVVIMIVLAVLLGVGIYFWKSRKQQSNNSNKIMIGKYHFDERNMKLVFKNDSIDLTSKETDLLMLLHSSINETLEREKILKEVWGDEGDYIGRTLDVFISKLRKKFSEDANVKIVNIRGVGYKLILNEVKGGS